MSGFISALIKQRKDAKKARPDINGRLKEIITIVRKQNYDNGITPEVIINILQDLGPTYVTLNRKRIIGVPVRLFGGTSPVLE